jgi:hypothetical protein
MKTTNFFNHVRHVKQAKKDLQSEYRRHFGSHNCNFNSDADSDADPETCIQCASQVCRHCAEDGWCFAKTCVYYSGSTTSCSSVLVFSEHLDGFILGNGLDWCKMCQTGYGTKKCTVCQNTKTVLDFDQKSDCCYGCLKKRCVVCKSTKAVSWFSDSSWHGVPKCRECLNTYQCKLNSLKRKANTSGSVASKR